MARHGKIARLPRSIRDQLNRRLDDGESGALLAEWLNALPEVRQVLAQDFAGRPVNEQNLTEWRQGGFLTWLRQQESCEWFRLVTDEGDHPEQSGLVPFSDRLSPTLALALGNVLHGFSADSLADPAKGKHLLQLLSEFTRLRRMDHEAARLRMDVEQYERTTARQRQEDLKQAQYAAEQAAQEAARKQLEQERAAAIEEANERYRLRFQKRKPSKLPKPPLSSSPSSPPSSQISPAPPTPSAPQCAGSSGDDSGRTESNRIRLNQAKSGYLGGADPPEDPSSSHPP